MVADNIARLAEEQKRRDERKKKTAGPDAALPGTEDEVALAFADRHAAELRYVNSWHKWLRWSGAHWRLVETLWVFHQVRLVAREYAKLHDGKKLGKDATTAAVERIARNDPRHDTAADAWDVDGDIVNTPNEERPQ
jgi:putative DNA primase/helicase